MKTKTESTSKSMVYPLMSLPEFLTDDLRLEYPDTEHSQDEERYVTIGLVHDVLTVVYCDRENIFSGQVDIRIISARLATKLERNAYNNSIIGRY